MSKPSAPKPPDPRETSAAQTGTSVATALANQSLNNVNQVGPDGSIMYSQTGESSFTDPYTGQTYKIPQTTQTTTLSPEQQAIANQTNATKLNLGTLANNQSSFLNDYMGKPFDGSNDATESRLMELARKRLDPMLADRTEALRTSLSNQGIKLGSSAYDRAMGLNEQGNNDALVQMLLQGHGQAYSEGQSTRNQPINEITALMSGSQVSQPNFGGTNRYDIPTTDNAGLINTQFNQQNDIYKQKSAAQQALVGGLFKMGSAFAGNPSAF